ncbi:MAG: hypothetical protein V3R78_09980 [Thermodesulfobacteriota bacterium]
MRITDKAFAGFLCLIVVAVIFIVGFQFGMIKQRSILNEAHLLKELILRGRIDTCQIQVVELERAYMQAITPINMEDLRAGLGLDEN